MMPTVCIMLAVVAFFAGNILGYFQGGLAIHKMWKEKSQNTIYRLFKTRSL